MSCPFCKLAGHEIIYQDDHCFGMVILEPLKDGHLMVVPKRHVESLDDLDKEESVAIMNLLGRFGKIMLEVYNEDPMILMNLGSHSTVAHIHLHILPSKGGLRDLYSTHEKILFRTKATAEERKKIGDKIREKLEQK